VIWFWGPWVAGYHILGAACFGLGQAGLAALAQMIAPPPRPDLSDEALAEFITAALDDTKLWERS
jgi:hypothetical protein